MWIEREQELAFVNGPFAVKLVTEGPHSRNETGTAVKFAGNEKRLIVLDGDDVLAARKRRSIDDDVGWTVLERSKRLV